MTRVQGVKHLREWREWGIPAVIFAVALAARLYLLFTHRYPMMIHEQDAVGYLAVAEKIRSFQPFFDAIRPPAYPLFIALFSLFPLDLELAARIASVFMDALIVMPLYGMGRTFLSRSGAAAAAILWGLFSFSLYFSISPLSQSTFLFFLCCAILFFIRGIEREGWRSGPLFLSGVLFAFSYQARPEGVVPFAAAGAVSLLCVLAKNVRRDRLRGALFLAAGFLLAAGPYLIFLRMQLGYWGFTAKTDMALKGVDGTLVLGAGGKLLSASQGIGAWKEHYVTVGNFLGAALTNGTQFAAVFYQTFPLWVHLLAAIGMVVLLVRKKWRALLCLALLAVSTLPDYIVNIPKTQSYLYGAFPVPFLLFAQFWEAVALFSERMLAKCCSSVGSGIREASVATMVLVPSLLLALFFFGQARAALEEPGLVREALTTEKVYLESGACIRAVSEPADTIMTRWGLIGYFAGRGVITLPKGGVREVVDYGRRNGARFLVIDTNSVLSRRQELMELLDPLQGKGVRREYGLEPLRWNYYPDVGGYVVYRYVP